MIKTVILVCCAFLLVDAQRPPAGGPPGGGPPGGGPPGGGPPGQSMKTLNRAVRQAPPDQNGPIPQGMSGGGGPGNLGMQGLGNIPDPTVWIAKGQEIASQFAKGRRRRQLAELNSEANSA